MKEQNNFKIGDRVKISNNYHWAKNATGKISQRLFTIEDEEWIENYYRDVKSLKGKIRFYWIKFDSPHFDSDGDGPYSEAEIDSEYLQSNHKSN